MFIIELRKNNKTVIYASVSMYDYCDVYELRKIRELWEKTFKPRNRWIEKYIVIFNRIRRII